MDAGVDTSSVICGRWVSTCTSRSLLLQARLKPWRKAPSRPAPTVRFCQRSMVCRRDTHLDTCGCADEAGFEATTDFRREADRSANVAEIPKAGRPGSRNFVFGAMPEAQCTPSAIAGTRDRAEEIAFVAQLIADPLRRLAYQNEAVIIDLENPQSPIFRGKHGASRNEARERRRICNVRR